MIAHCGSRLCHSHRFSANHPVRSSLSFLQFSAFMHDLRGFSATKSRDLVDKSFSEAVSTCKGDKVSHGTT